MRGFGAVEVKEVVGAGHKDLKAFAAWLTRNAKDRLKAGASGPKLVVTMTLDPSDLREEGGLITTKWRGTVALDVAFADEKGASVARMRTQASPAAGHLEPAGDRLLDDVVDFLLSP